MRYPIDPHDDEMAHTGVLRGRRRPGLEPWWLSLPLRWLLAAPLVAIVLIVVFGQRIHALSAKTMAIWYSERSAQKVSEDDIEGALADAERAMRWAPESANLFYLRAQIYEEQFRRDEALADYDVVIRVAPSFAPAYLRRANLRRENRQYRPAMEDLNTAVRLSPANDPAPLRNRAMQRAQMGIELDEAFADITQAMKLAENPPAEFFDARAWIWYRKGKLDDAQDDAVAAVEMFEASMAHITGQPSFQSLSLRRQQRILRLQNQQLAEMLRRRAQIYRRSGYDHLSDIDYQRADELQFGEPLP